MGKWKILENVDEGGVFLQKPLMRNGICLSGLLGIRLNLRRLIVFLNIHFPILVHSMLDLITLLFGATCVIALTII